MCHRGVGLPRVRKTCTVPQVAKAVLKGHHMPTIRVPSPVRLKTGIRETLKEKLVYVAPGVQNVSFEHEEERKPVLVLEYTGTLEENILKGKVSDMVRDFARGFMEVQKEILFYRRDVVPRNNTPIYEELQRRGWIHVYEPGRVLLSGPVKRLFDFFDGAFEQIGARYGAISDKYPVLIGADTLQTADYFASFPHHITLASHLVEEVEGIKAFQSKAMEGSVEFAPLKKVTGHVCSPAVCFHLYQALAGRDLGEEVVCRTAVGPCFRYESGNLQTLERLWDFTMREIIFVGASHKVDALRLSAMEPVMELVDILGLKAYIETASDPFFVNNYAGQTFFQLSHKTKYELRLALPQKEGASLAAGSFNWHQQFFGGKFGIVAEGSAAGTACVAFGVERWVYAFLSQYGLDRDTWPKTLLERW